MLDKAALRAELMGFMPFNPIEAFNQQNMLRLLDESTELPVTRKQFLPGHFTASAWVLAADTQRVLLMHQLKSNRWFQPGGHIEPEDKSLVEGAAREIAEECGINADVAYAPHLFDVDIHGINEHKDEPDHFHFDMRYLFMLKREVPPVATGDAGVKDVRWATLDEAQQLMGRSVHNSRMIAKSRVLFSSLEK